MRTKTLKWLVTVVDRHVVLMKGSPLPDAGSLWRSSSGPLPAEPFCERLFCRSAAAAAAQELSAALAADRWSFGAARGHLTTTPRYITAEEAKSSAPQTRHHS